MNSVPPMKSLGQPFCNGLEIPTEVWICDNSDELTRMDKLTAKIFGNKADWIKISNGPIPLGTLVVWKEKSL